MATSRMKTAYKTESRIKTALFYAVELLIDVLIVFVIVRGFSVAYSFSYEVFSDSAKTPGDISYTVVTIQPDFTSMSVSETLYDKGVIKNKYVMLAKIKLGEYGSEIKAGKYAISPSMTYDEILKVITAGAATAEGEEEVRDASKIGDTGKVATEAAFDSEESSTESTEESDGRDDTDDTNYRDDE